MDLLQESVQSLSLIDNIIPSKVNTKYRSVSNKDINIEYWIKINGQMQKIVIKNEELKLLYNIISNRVEGFVDLLTKNDGNKVDKIYIGGLWDGNKIEDIIIRELCYIKTNFILVFLNYINDTPETTCFKLFNSNCNLLIYDRNINIDYIEKVNSILFKEYKTKIFALPSDELISESDVFNLIRENYGGTYLRNYFNTKVGTESVKSGYLKGNYKENIQYSYSKENNCFFSVGAELGKDHPVGISDSVMEERRNNYFDDDGINRSELIRGIIYTTGTTGIPKGVRLSYKNFETTIKSIDMLCTNGNNKKVIFVITNPLHHINSTCFVDYCFRNSIEMVIFHRYSRDFWSVLDKIINERVINYNDNFSIIVPLVPKHIEYFTSTLKTEYYEDKNELLKSLSHPSIYYFFGSSTVSYDFFKNFKDLFNGKIPRVRFGSTETCLQVCGTDLYLTDELVEIGFRKGIKDEGKGSTDHKNNGYFIGRSINPYSEVFIVKSIEPVSEDFLIPCKEYELGYIICRGDNIMKGYTHKEEVLVNSESLNVTKYVKDNKLDKRVYVCDNHPWYIGLGDQGFWVRGEDCLKNNNEMSIYKTTCKECACCNNDIVIDNKWIYWVSRSKYIIKIGGVKYSSEEINKRLRKEIVSFYDISSPDNFKTVVMGFEDKKNISEDDKIIFFYEKFDGITVEGLRKDFEKMKIPKSYLPYKIIKAEIKKNSKGNVDFEKMRELIINLPN
ncbi:acyl-synthetase [Cryptosporidium xiaoi]|uniref:Acyl-synthetase n=1 Tax=Cryptosporidium xiaoi TaxID=659607 RepID=A0AAV9XXZ3_9CRYT